MNSVNTGDDVNCRHSKEISREAPNVIIVLVLLPLP